MADSNFWTQQQEAKLLAWHRMQQVADQKKPAPCFTIAREFGCQAYPLAEELIRRLNARVAGEPWVVIGREILDEVAEISGYRVEQIEKSQDTPASLKAIFAMFLDSSRAEETEVFAHMKTVIRSFARRGNCVLVGRGAVFAAQDLPNCIHLRLVAPRAFRVRNIMRAHKLSEVEAAKFIELHQQQRDAFVRRFAEGQLENSELYHLVINNSRLGVDKIAELVEEYMISYTS
ncbi:MAG: cytidylate kinase-like family protein [Desulfuromusa sp.]|jgi:cytidylate kinase|nr:cytidylate kinase-like family protein [Desulfuromusa sp.]